MGNKLGSKNNVQIRATKMQLRFVKYYEGDAMEAAAKAGSKRPSQTGYEFMHKPHILALIAEKQSAMAKQSGKDLARGVTITRNDILNRLDKLSASAESEGARVAALGLLVDIFGLKPKDKNLDIFADWTDEELVHYRETGELPLRFGPSSENDGNPTTDTSISPDSRS